MRAIRSGSCFRLRYAACFAALLGYLRGWPRFFGLDSVMVSSAHSGFRRVKQLVNDLFVTALRAFVLVPTIFKAPAVDDRARHLRLRQLWSVTARHQPNSFSEIHCVSVR
jgi:hypothetical protein